jgi:hypothetical protein
MISTTIPVIASQFPQYSDFVTNFVRFRHAKEGDLNESDKSATMNKSRSGDTGGQENIGSRDSGQAKNL